MEAVMKGITYYEESLITLLSEIEALLNSVPLLPCNNDFSDFDALTPYDIIMKKFENFTPGDLTKTILVSEKNLIRYSHIRKNFGKDL